MNDNLGYACRGCGGKVFFTDPNSYDIFCAEGDGFRLEESVWIDREEKLYCRDCGEGFTVPSEILRR